MNADLDPRSIDIHGNNAIHQAAAASQLAVMKLFMSQGVDLDVRNDRGHNPFDLTTSPEIKGLITKSHKQLNCCGNKCGKAKFTFQNTQFYCAECDKRNKESFYCKKCCKIYRVYDSIDSEYKEKTVCRCDDCHATIQDSE
jgi:hypothetical protein